MTRSQSRGVILLTAAVQPHPALTVTLSDPERRLEQYLAAITFWTEECEKVGYDLCVVETSGYDLSRHVISTTPIRVFNHEPSWAVALRGKGAIEADALDAVVRELSAYLPPDCSVFKVTGRLTIDSPARLLLPLVEQDFRVRRTLDRHFCDTRLLSFRLESWSAYMLNMQSEIDDAKERYIEHVIAERLTTAELRGAVVGRYPRKPLFLGQSGTSGSTYGRGLPGLPPRFIEFLESQLLLFSRRKQI